MNKENGNVSVSKLRFPEFGNKSVIDLENGNDIFDSICDKNHNSDIPVLAITQEHGAIPRDQIDYNVFVTDKSLESYKVVKIGDFIISLRSFQGGIEYSLFHGICSPAYVILRKKVDVIEQYYKYYFKTSKFIQDLNKNLEGIRDGKMVSYTQFSAILLPKPENKEQQKIADCLSSLDDLITFENKKLETLKAHKKGLLQNLFPAEGKTVPKWRFPEFNDYGEWENKKLGEICEKIGDGLHGTPEYVLESDYYFVNGNNLNNGHLEFNNPKYVSKNVALKNNKFLSDCTILISINGTIGNIAYYNNEKIMLGKSIAYLNIKDTQTKFIFHCLQSYYIRSQFLLSLTGSTIKNLGLQSIRNTNIMRPALKEQQKIANCLSSVDELITAQTQKIATLKTHKKGLMQGLFPSIEEVSE